jgi:hypothetical protein
MYDIAREERKFRIACYVMLSLQVAMMFALVAIGVWKLT